MDKFWQGQSQTTLYGRKQAPAEFFYQHSRLIRPLDPSHTDTTTRVCYSLPGDVKPMETRTLYSLSCNLSY